MKFSSTAILIALGFSTAVFSAPVQEKRQTTAVGTITDAVDTLQNTVTADEAAIGEFSLRMRNAISCFSNLTGSTAASVVQEYGAGVSTAAAVAAAINGYLQNMATAFMTATTQINSVTTGAAGGIAGAASGFSQQEIDELTTDIGTAREAIGSIQATYSLFVTDLTPAIQMAISAEMQNVENTIGPFDTPLEALASAVEGAQVNGGANVTGLQGAVAALVNIIGELLGTII